ncbi:ogr/Delta-like zinc finger family protein, partial [Escherichia coli]|uniref:ogr/Delta-like zinc finger family protein n=1 Tax=Escherichia coli TaxID=562 RepID=UPI0031B61AAF
MKMMRMYCPTCQAVARIGKTNRKHPQLYDVYCYCSNVECGHSFVMNVAFAKWHLNRSWFGITIDHD